MRLAPEVLSVCGAIAIVPKLRVGRILTNLVQEKAAEVADLMKERLNVRGKDLATKLRHTGRMMPKRIKREARFLADAAALAENPKLSRMIDPVRVETAHLACIGFLENVDVADRRKGVLLGILGSVTLTIVVVSALVITVLVWRGYL